MISRSEGFANAFLAFLNPDKDLKGISEAPPTSCKPAAPVKAQKAKRSVNRKLPDDFLDEDDIPVLNIIPNRLEGDVSEEELEELKEVPKKTPRKRGAPQRSKNVPTPKRRAKKVEEPEEIEELEESDDDETDEDSVEEKELELNAGDSDFEVELKEAPNRRDVSSRRSARATRKSFAQLLKDDDTDDSDSDDIVEVPSSPIESKEEVKSSSHNQVKEPPSSDESSKAVSKPKGKRGRPPRRQSRVPKSEPSTKSSESSEENIGIKQKGTKGQVPGTLHNQPIARKRGRPPQKKSPEKNESEKEMDSEVVSEIRPRSKRARQPSKRISQDSDDEPLAKSARKSRNGIPKPAVVRKVAKKDAQEPSTSKPSDDEEQPIPTNRQSGLNKRKVSEKKETPNRSKGSLKPITSESNSSENSKDSQILPQTVTSPSKIKLAEPMETGPNNANVKVPSVVAINCSRCSKSVASEQELMSHFNSVHRAEILKANQSKIKIKSISKLHSCPHCTYKTEWESSLGIHVKLSHANISRSAKTTD